MQDRIELVQINYMPLDKFLVYGPRNQSLDRDQCGMSLAAMWLARGAPICPRCGIQMHNVDSHATTQRLALELYLRTSVWQAACILTGLSAR